MTPTEEAEEVVNDFVDDGRQKIIDKHEKLVETAVERLSNMREKNVVFSEIHRRLENNG
jgi:vacuolar-type H+-ATPase subunit H